MYPPLKKAIWHEIDAAVLRRFGARPSGRGVTRRAYLFRAGDVSAFLVAQFGDVAGGCFSFLCALGNAAVPDGSTTYAPTLCRPGPGAICMVDAALLAGSSCTIGIELAWLTPPVERVLEALQRPEAKPFLDTLGVTPVERHHMLSLELLETFGVTISDADFRPVVETVKPLVATAIDGPVARAVEVLLQAMSAEHFP